MSNKYFNKQVAESRKPLNIGGPAGEMISPKPLDNIRSKGDKMKEYLIGNKETRDKLRKKKSDMRTNKKTYAPEWKHNPKITKVRIKKKEVEGLK